MSLCTIRVLDTPNLAAASAGDAFLEGMSDFGSRLAGLAAGRKMHPVYDHLVWAETQSSGLFSKTAFAPLDEVVSEVHLEANVADPLDT